MSRMMVPRDLLEYFDIFDVKGLSSEWDIVPKEKEDLIPKALKGGIRRGNGWIL
jgi:hypothetical protein